MSLPAPQPGLVIRYSYLWAADAARGRQDGDKDRPAAIVMTVPTPGAALPRVLVLPITHSPPAAGTAALEIPPVVARKAGLDAARAWVILAEFNEFVWPGCVRPGTRLRSATVAYGFLTPGFFKTLRDRWLALDAAGKSRPIGRDD